MQVRTDGSLGSDSLVRHIWCDGDVDHVNGHIDERATSRFATVRARETGDLTHTQRAATEHTHTHTHTNTNTTALEALYPLLSLASRMVSSQHTHSTHTLSLTHTQITHPQTGM